VKIIIAPCSARAVNYAIIHWHYSKRVPIGRSNRFGLWEDGEFKGIIMFTRGSGAMWKNGIKFGLQDVHVCELARIALDDHQMPVTQLMKITIALLKKKNPDLQLIVSYADNSQGHLGKIYQAGNWIYTGTTGNGREFIVRGRRYHSRGASSSFGTAKLSELQKIDPQATVLNSGFRYRYLYPLNKKLRKQIQKYSRPYPKELRGCGVNSSTSAVQAESSGANPTQPLQLFKATV